MNYIRYLHVEVDESARRASVDCKKTTLEFPSRPPSGYALLRMKQFGTCTSEIPYYLGKGGHPSRFLADLKDKKKQDVYFSQIYKQILVDTTETREAIVHSPFHEGFGEIVASTPDLNKKPISVITYLPIIKNKGVVGLKRKILETNFQTNLDSGRLAVLNPAYICDYHSSADSIDPKTGWPVQCNRNTDNGHQPKATRGHTEVMGTAVQGIVPARLDSLTPVPQELQKFIEEDPNRSIILTSVEPMGCVFQAHGPLLRDGQIPNSILVIGDGPNALLNLMFYQAFAPNANVVVSGKNQKKLAIMRAVNPQRIVTVLSDGKSYDEVTKALKDTTGSKQADIVLPTVALPEDVVDPFVKDRGLLIWWAASIAEHAKGEASVVKRYKELHSYGGAPRAELSAMALMDGFARTRPEIFTPLLQTPAVHYLSMGKEAAVAVESWLNAGGKWIGPDGLSKKLIINM